MIFQCLRHGGEHFCSGTRVVLWGHLDIHDSWTSLSLNLPLFLGFLPSSGLRWELHRHGLRVIRQLLQSAAGVSESDISLVFTCFSPSAHTSPWLQVSLKAIWEQQSSFLATLPKFSTDGTSCFMVWMTVLLRRTTRTKMFHVREPSFDLIHESQLWSALAASCFSKIFSLFLTNREPEYYDYGHGESTESYESYGKKKKCISLINMT